MTTDPQEITSSDDLIDSRDVIARIEYVREQLTERLYADLAERDAFEGELALLEALASEANGTPDWEYGETLIRDSYFEDYARELAEDIGAIPSDAGWPAYCIDWEWAARELQHDYFSVEFDGITYWVRA